MFFLALPVALVHPVALDLLVLFSGPCQAAVAAWGLLCQMAALVASLGTAAGQDPPAPCSCSHISLSRTYPLANSSADGQPCMTLLERDAARHPRARIHVHRPRGRRQPAVLRCSTHHGSGAPFPTFLTLPDFACISRGFDRHLDGRDLGQSRVGWDAGPNRQFCHLARGPADCRLHSDFMPTSQSGWAVKHPRQQDDAAVNWDPAKPTCDGNMRMSLCACVA